MFSASKKRKLVEDSAAKAPSQKYYAVRTGQPPGVYTTWADCQRVTTGFKGAVYKSFPTEQEARDFVAGKATSMSKSKGNKFYGVAVGEVPGVYEEWTDVQEQIKSVKGPKYKKFGTRAEAEEFVRTGGKSSAVLVFKKEVEDEFEVEEPTTKRARTSTASGSGSKAIRVYTDGSSRGNGKLGAYAGVGVYFGDDDPRNVSEPLLGVPQTNQRAELTAVQRALEIVPRNRDIHIITDSSYTINCCETWYKNWKKNNWRTSAGGPVLNKDLVVAIRDLIDKREENGATTIFEWIKGHSNDSGNEAADQLAVAGAFAGRS